MIQRDKCHTLSFNLFRHLVLLNALFLHDVLIMQDSMGCLMDGSFHCLHLAHAGLDNDLFIDVIVIALCTAAYLIKADRYRRNTSDRVQKDLVVFHAGRQLTWTQLRKRIAIRLRQIKNGGNLEPRNNNRYFFDFRLAVFTQHDFSRIGINFFLLLFFLEGSRCNDLDSFFSLHHMSVELFLPSVIPGH